MHDEISPAIWLQVHDLRMPLEEAEETLRAIRQGEVDALVVKPDADARVLTLAGADAIYRSLLDTLNEGALTLGPDERILTANARFAALVGVTPVEAAGTPLSRFVAQEEREKLHSLFAASHAGESKGEVLFYRADGSTAAMRVSLRAVPVPGAGYLTTAVLTDVSELRAAQSALEAVNADLEARVAERTAALVAADQRKDEFLAMLGHELRNPLAALSNALYLLRRRSDPAGARAVEVMERQVQRLVRLAGDLTDLARIRQKKESLTPLRLDLARLVEQTVEDSRGIFDSAELSLALERPPAPVWVEGDADRLAQVVSNLLQNAVKFTDPGGRVTVRLGVESFSEVPRRHGDTEGITERQREEPAGADAPVFPSSVTASVSPCLRGTSEPAPTQAVLTVSDTGIGIEPELLAEIFETFRQVEESAEAPRPRGRGGLGLGLALVKGWVEMHGGSIHAHSDGPGHGAVFTICLPLAEPPPAGEVE